jgi:predicted MFS family arabinose efflux permease
LLRPTGARTEARCSRVLWAQAGGRSELRLVLRLSNGSATLRTGGLGLAQLVAWGTLYYAIALLAAPIARDFGVTEPVVYAMFSGSLAVAGVLAPSVGRLLDRRGGRAVLIASGAWGAAGFALLALAPSVPLLAVGFALNGIAMAFGLYDSCFAAVAQIERASYRNTLTSITLLGGLASTVFWPVTHALLERIEWRGTCAVFAALLLACSALYAGLLPGYTMARPLLSQPQAGSSVDPATRWRARWLALAFAGAALVSGALSAHLVSLLGTLRFASSSAVWIAAAIGVSQVLGRLVERLAGGRMAALRLGLFVFAAQAASLVFLLACGQSSWLVLPFVLLYGSANGLLTVVRAVVPLELFGIQRVGAMLGSFARPSLLARALAPAAFSALAAIVGSLAALAATAGVAMAALAAFGASVRGIHPRSVSARSTGAALVAALLLAGGSGLVAACGEVKPSGAPAGGPAQQPATLAAASTARVPLRVLVVGDLEGVVEPCGCGSRPAGGLDRLATAISAARAGAEHTLLFAAGNLLFAPQTASGYVVRVQDRWKAELVATLLQRLRPDAIEPGPADLAQGAEQLRSLSTANAVLLGAASPSLMRAAGKTQVGVVAARGDGASLQDEIARLRARGATFVLATVRGDDELARRTAERSGADVVVQTGATEQEPGLRNVGPSAWLARPGRHGEGLLVLDIGASVVGEYVALTADMPGDVEVRAQLAQLFARINTHNATEAKQDAAEPPREHGIALAGSEACAACHTQAYYWWRSTPHGRAYDTLVARGRELDLDCVGCHVTGFVDASANLSGVAQRKGVGCESCHGPGGAHVDDPRPPLRGIQRAVPEARCAACHDREHSAAFVYAERLARLDAPGHAVAR